MAPVSLSEGEVPPSGLRALDSRSMESAEANLEQQMIENQAEQSQLEAQALSRIKLPANTNKTEVLVKHIRESVQKDPLAAANILRTWVAEVEGKRS